MNIVSRKLMMAALVAAFFGQSALVYADTTGDERAQHGELALEGRAIWHRENCQVCHQLYGFGGFLGPDLTNAASRVNRARLDDILTNGSRQMPAFGMSPAEIDAIEAFLQTLDQTGVGQARRYRMLAQSDILAMIETHCDENPMTEAAVRGFDRFRMQCVACHTPFRATPLGPFLAADLSTVVRRLDEESLERTLVDGRPERGMPPTGCDADVRADLIAFLQWLGAEEPTLRPRCDAAKVDLGHPWFEYK
ncbi:MAG: cytochrome c [Planctomycetes bacterium]|nr:cytochrome c [Planctomycetota bacterium]